MIIRFITLVTLKINLKYKKSNDLNFSQGSGNLLNQIEEDSGL